MDEQATLQEDLLTDWRPVPNENVRGAAGEFRSRSLFYYESDIPDMPNGVRPFCKCAKCKEIRAREMEAEGLMLWDDA